ncbi:MAG: ABC transporter ATP-binding protein/permease [Lachnospiraceae bacterium]|nr:ABC transporter ATP-binding protein/permease [Lachnospiraceae bacterium]
MKVKVNPLKDLMEYAGSYGFLVTLGRLLAGASALVGMVPYYLLWKILKVAIEGEALNDIKGLGIRAVVVMLLSMLIYIAALFCTHIASFHMQANMRSKLLNKVINLPMGIFDEEGTGRIRRIIVDSTAATETFVAHNLPDKAVASATPIGLAVLMLAFDYRIGIICLIPVLLGFVCMMGMMGKNMQTKMGEFMNAMEVMSNEGVEYVRGIPVVKTFGQSVFSFKRFKDSIDHFSSWAMDYTVMVRPAMVRFMTCINGIFAAIICAAYFLGRDGITPRLVLNVMYYIIITPLLTVAMTKLAYTGEQEMQVVDAIERVKSILSYEPLKESSSGKVPSDHTIEVKNISYRYPEATADAVKDLSLTIKPGSKVALVGPSGGGKTTTAQLITRFFDVSAGSISIGGVDVKDIPQKELMKLVSFVFQDSHLLKMSILENVRLSKPSATEAEVLHALEEAQCMDIIDKLPQGIHTMIGTRGTYLSGGEQQRITLARAFLKDAPILILDEATAFADPDNEAKMQAAFTKLSEKKTLIMIAHRLSTVVGADQIYVLANGTCAEQGTHNELMQQNGIYHRMYDEYNRSVAWKVGVAQ